jgi:hypothetical protein
MIKEKQIEEAKDYLMNKLDRENAKRQDSWLKIELVNIYQYLQKITILQYTESANIDFDIRNRKITNESF